MNTEVWMAGAVGLAAAGGLCWWLLSGRRRGLPFELRGAELFCSEQTFQADRPLPLVARVDRVYRLPSGPLVLVELKHRRADRVHRSDRLQLSAQRLAVAGHTGLAVADWGFVVVDRGIRWSRPRWRRVSLMETGAVVEVSRRRWQVLAGQTDASLAKDAVVCRTCGFRGGLCPGR